MTDPVDNSEQYQLVDVSELKAYLWELHMKGRSHLPAPATVGACLECDRQDEALWIVGDFLLCVRCCANRARAASAAGVDFRATSG